LDLNQAICIGIMDGSILFDVTGCLSLWIYWRRLSEVNVFECINNNILRRCNSITAWMQMAPSFMKLQLLSTQLYINTFAPFLRRALLNDFLRYPLALQLNCYNFLFEQHLLYSLVHQPFVYFLLKTEDWCLTCLLPFPSKKHWRVSNRIKIILQTVFHLHSYKFKF
jgi:hypothetical protein